MTHCASIRKHTCFTLRLTTTPYDASKVTDARSVVAGCQEAIVGACSHFGPLPQKVRLVSFAPQRARVPVPAKSGRLTAASPPAPCARRHMAPCSSTDTGREVSYACMNTHAFIRMRACFSFLVTTPLSVPTSDIYAPHPPCLLYLVRWGGRARALRDDTLHRPVHFAGG